MAYLYRKNRSPFWYIQYLDSESKKHDTTPARCRIRSFAPIVEDVGVNRSRVVQQVVVLILEVFVEERKRAGSYRLAYSLGSGGWVTRT